MSDEVEIEAARLEYLQAQKQARTCQLLEANTAIEGKTINKAVAPKLIPNEAFRRLLGQ